MGKGLELITRAGCHLCEEAASALVAAGIAFQARDVDSDAELSRLYDWRVPVLLRDGAVVTEGVIDASTIAALNLSSREPSSGSGSTAPAG